MAWSDGTQLLLPNKHTHVSENLRTHTMLTRAAALPRDEHAHVSAIRAIHMRKQMYAHLKIEQAPFRVVLASVCPSLNFCGMQRSRYTPL